MRDLIALLLLIVASPVAAAEEFQRPVGAVLLTVAGDIEHTNREAFDKVADPFIAFHERKFERAVEFDRAMLEALGMETVEIDFDGWGGTIRFQGPRLAAVLDFVGAGSERLTTLALDGFGTKLSPDDIEAHDWILATRGNGRPFGIGQRGPLWLVYDPPGTRKATQDEEAKWPWAIFLIQVE